ncbi:MAG: T9SS type A sorting domain-containing protein, partial [Sphingomonadales bacterium]
VLYDANLAGIHDSNLAPIQVFPNPTSETIQITGLQINDLLELFDVTGQLIHVVNATNSSAQLTLPKVGLYILKCSSHTQPQTVLKLQRI